MNDPSSDMRFITILKDFLNGTLQEDYSDPPAYKYGPANRFPKIEVSK